MRRFGLISAVILGGYLAMAMKPASQPLHIAIFIPLGLDKLYNPDSKHHNYIIRDTDNVDYNEEAWNFYVGTKMAIDSLKMQNLAHRPIAFHYHDVTSLESPQSLRNIMHNQNYKPDLLIGFAFGNAFQYLANFARKFKIPFVSAVYPNLTAQQDNEFLLVLNPTLRTHIRALLRNIRDKNISIIMKSGEYPEILHGIVQDVKREISSEKRVRYITLRDTAETTIRINLGAAQPRDQSFVLLSFDQDFVKKLLLFFNNMANKDKIYQLNGLPLWEEMPFIQTFMPKYMQLTHSRGPYYNPNHPLIARLKKTYEYYYFSPFNDMVGLGFESLYRFTALLQEYPDFHEWSEHIQDTTVLSLSNFSLRPYLRSASDSGGAWTNEKIYFRIMKNRRSAYVAE